MRRRAVWIPSIRNSPGGNSVAVYGVSGAIAITGANSGDDTCVLLNDGTVECWGDYRVTGTPTKVDGIANAVAIASGYSDTCALIADGSVDCWGTVFWGA